MRPPHRFAAGEVGQRAGDAQHAVIAARRLFQLAGRVVEQRPARLVWRGDAVEQFAIGPRAASAE